MMQYRPIYRILLILENPEVSSRIVDRFRERGDDVLIASDAARHRDQQPQRRDSSQHSFHDDGLVR